MQSRDEAVFFRPKHHHAKLSGAIMTQTKKCRKCCEIKPIEDFSKSKCYSDGFKSVCKKCEYEIAKENKVKKIKSLFDNALCQQFLRGAYG